MSLRWDAEDIIGQLTELYDRTMDTSEDVVDGAQVILERSNMLVPKAPKEPSDEEPVLVSTGLIEPDGHDRARIIYDSVYAHWIHEHLWFHHPHGGQAKFLETAMLEKGQEAINRAGEHLFRRL